MSRTGIAIIGSACRYPDAKSPAELFENALAGRRAFRRLPNERLRTADYFSPDPNAPDKTYCVQAAVIADYEFDRVAHRVAGNTFRSTDLAHWLALDVAGQALSDAGFPNGDGLNRARCGVVVGNTLTGEFSRAEVMRLRWPFVERVLAAALASSDVGGTERDALITDVERRFKEPFAPVGDETLAGGLSNTIAGRICNHFDFGGGGFTVDGACSSSLLAVTQAASALESGDVDVVLAGGVDLSLDPFELVGFAKVGALAPEKMRVYDERSKGFWPGEGCGFIVMMREDFAARCGLKPHAVVRGWGISSDGAGGLTRPDVAGQRRALERAYARAGFGIDSVELFEGHGTGTTVGDAVELTTLWEARAASDASSAAALGTIKANIGHTKAAAGIAGLLKAIRALDSGLLPPTTGCERPHPVLRSDPAMLRVLGRGEPWPEGRPRRAAVSAMGFGGINAHVVLESNAAPDPNRSVGVPTRLRRCLNSAQDCELFLFTARSPEQLAQQVRKVKERASSLSIAELTDLAAMLSTQAESVRLRAAVVADTPAALDKRLGQLLQWVNGEPSSPKLDPNAGVYLGRAGAAPRIGYLFPGQGGKARTRPGIWGARFARVEERYAAAGLPAADETVATEVVQPAAIIAALSGAELLADVGLSASVVVGHSVGELAALCWAGATGEKAALRLAEERGRAMAEHCLPGAMASLSADAERVAALLSGTSVVIAGENSPQRNVVSGPRDAVIALLETASARGIDAQLLDVSHAFHSASMEPTLPAFRKALAATNFDRPRAGIVSTLTGAALAPDTDLPAYLERQILEPVRFSTAVSTASGDVDLFIEVGAGRSLSALTAECCETPAIALDVAGNSLSGLLNACGAAFALGAPLDHEVLFGGRLTRAFDVDHAPSFFANPCERAPLPTRKSDSNVRASSVHEATPSPTPSVQAERDVDPRPADTPRSALAATNGTSQRSSGTAADPLSTLQALIAERTELPLSAMDPKSRLLDDLHLNSIAAGQIAAAAASALGLPPLVSPTGFANASVEELARALADHAQTLPGEGTAGRDEPVLGAASWVRPFRVHWAERAAPGTAPVEAAPDGATWRLFAPPEHPLGSALLKSLPARNGCVVCLPKDPGPRELSLLLDAAKHAITKTHTTHWLLVQHTSGSEAFAKTLHTEAAELSVSVVTVPEDFADTSKIGREVTDAKGYHEARYDASGARFEPFAELLPSVGTASHPPLEPRQILLVSGGGKGITRECALELAQCWNVELALLGRSDPEQDEELRKNLAQLEAGGVAFSYTRCDMTDAAAVERSVSTITERHGPIAGILHGAGLNQPETLQSMTLDSLSRTVAPKVLGLEHLLSSVDTRQLRLLVCFGSIIARTGLPGEAHYGLANGWMTRRLQAFGESHPGCRCLSLEWSVWSGVGMGERLGSVEALSQRDVMAIGPEQGVRLCRELLERSYSERALIVSSRFGDPQTLRLSRAELPFWRFLEQPRLHYPGVELVVDAELSRENDPYLLDHVFEGEVILPAVMALEAMAQVATALCGTAPSYGPLPQFSKLQWERPVILPADGNVTVRIAALLDRARSPEGHAEVSLVLRSSSTDFQVDHLRARCSFEPSALPLAPDVASENSIGPAPPALALNPQQDLYGGLLFQAGRFRRVEKYHRTSSTGCEATLAAREQHWFGRALPRTLLLGDPGARDAVMHALQVCVPDGVLLPVAIERLHLSQATQRGELRLHARERSHAGDDFIYDIDVLDASGEPSEQWRGLHLRRVTRSRSNGWVASLLGPYIERRVSEFCGPGTVRVVLENGVGERSRRSELAMQRALDTTTPILRDGNGKPAVAGIAVSPGDGDARLADDSATRAAVSQRSVSASHSGDITLAVAGCAPLGCDIEVVTARPRGDWLELLGRSRRLLDQLAKTAKEGPDVAATRVWTAREALRKAGLPPEAPISVAAAHPDGWVVLRSGPVTVATLQVDLGAPGEPVVLAVATPTMPGARGAGFA